VTRTEALVVVMQCANTKLIEFFVALLHPRFSASQQRRGLEGAQKGVGGRFFCLCRTCHNS